MIVEQWVTLSDGTPVVEAVQREAQLALDVAEILPLFNYDHLPPVLQAASRPFFELAHLVVADAPGPSLQLVDALTHLVKAKDAAVRARKVPPVRRTLQEAAGGEPSSGG